MGEMRRRSIGGLAPHKSTEIRSLWVARAASRAHTHSNLSKFCFMADSPAHLRQQARHCRALASGTGDERTRSILRTMAEEFETEAVRISPLPPNYVAGS
jgi:hypothetical protein